MLDALLGITLLLQCHTYNADNLTADTAAAVHKNKVPMVSIAHKMYVLHIISSYKQSAWQGSPSHVKHSLAP